MIRVGEAVVLGTIRGLTELRRASRTAARDAWTVRALVLVEETVFGL